jgi:hypothetical protein
VRRDGLVLSGGTRLAQHGLDEYTQLDDYRHRMAGDNLGLDMDLREIEVEALRGTKRVIRRYYDSWGL